MAFETLNSPLRIDPVLEWMELDSGWEGEIALLERAIQDAGHHEPTASSIPLELIPLVHQVAESVHRGEHAMHEKWVSPSQQCSHLPSSAPLTIIPFLYRCAG